MKYDRSEEKEKLEQVNEELVKFMRDYPKDKLSLTAIGNSISDGFSMSEPGKLLLDRNLGLIDFGKSEGIDVQTYHLTRSENNNALAVSNWIIQNCCENDTHNWNKADYERAIKSGHPLLTEEQINESVRKILKLKPGCIVLLANPFDREGEEFKSTRDMKKIEKLIKFYVKNGFQRIENTQYLTINMDYKY